MEKRQKKPKSISLTWIGGGIVFTAIIVTVGVSWILYEHTVSLLTDNLRERLLSIAITQAANIDPVDLDQLQKEDDWKKPEWKKVVSSLKKSKNNNSNIVFMYIYRKKTNDPMKMEFVADAESINPYANSDNDPSNDIDANGDGKIEPDGPDYLQWPGQDYETPPEEAYDAYNGPLTNHELYEDSYGQVLTGYAPIKNEKGEVVAVLGTDIKVNDFLEVTRQTLYPFLSFVFFLVAAIVVLSVVLIKIWNKRVELFAELDRQKDELLSMVSHQLATPITSVKWYIEMMLSGDLGVISSDQKKHLSSMQAITENLSDLVGMILDVSRIQLGKMKIEKQNLNLDSFFREIIIETEPRAKEKNITFEVKLPQVFPSANLDKRYTRMTIENLITNAIKYTPEGGLVSIEVEINNNILKCVVRDSGCGIPKSDQSKIFGRLYRASNVRNTIDGNGFGLYVAKGAIEAQGGELTFESEENKGSIFKLRVPIN